MPTTGLFPREAGEDCPTQWGGSRAWLSHGPGLEGKDTCGRGKASSPGIVTDGDTGVDPGEESLASAISSQALGNHSQV